MDLYKHYYRPTRILLIALGLWPYNDSVFKPIQKTFFILLFAFSISLQIGKIIMSVNDLNSLFEVLWFAVASLIISVKYITYCIIVKDIKKLTDVIRRDWYTIKCKEEIEILKQYTNIAYMLTISVTITYYFIIFGFLTFQLLPKILDVVVPLNESRPVELLGLATYFFDQEKYFFPILGHMVVALYAEATTIIGTETLALLQVQHICGLLKIIRFLCNFNSCFETSYFIIYWMGLSSLSINMFRLLQALIKKEIGQSLASGIFISCHFTYMLISHLLPQFMINYSNDLFYQLYNVPWYSTPVQLQKMIQLIIQRMIKPFKFTLYMFDISLERFAWLLNICLSYFTIFWSMQY